MTERPASDRQEPATTGGGAHVAGTEVAAAPAQLDASVIVPTFREAGNLAPLAERLFAATGDSGLHVEMIVVDDNSNDGTEDVVAELARRFPVRIVVRRNERGLSSAVIRGFEHARAERLVVMDADLQHPPERVPELVRRLGEDGCDFVIGTRYSGPGRIVADWPWHRRLASKVASLLARPLTPLSDPMSGFFAIRRERWQAAAAVNPIGYKIALELYVKARCRRPGEVPIEFGIRQAGESKLTGKVLVHYLLHLVQLYRFRFPWLIWVLGGIVLVALVGGVAVLCQGGFTRHACLPIGSPFLPQRGT
jgi:dolichol-phosphate mannosyltransferase